MGFCLKAFSFKTKNLSTPRHLSSRMHLESLLPFKNILSFWKYRWLSWFPTQFGLRHLLESEPLATILQRCSFPPATAGRWSPCIPSLRLLAQQCIRAPGQAQPHSTASCCHFLCRTGPKACFLATWYPGILAQNTRPVQTG